VAQPADKMIYDNVPAFTLQPLARQPEPTPSLATPVGTPCFIDDVAAGRVELPVIPAVVQELMGVMRDPDVDSRRISQTLARDPVLTSKVLRLAQSSHYGGQRAMASIEAAVGLIGMAALGRLVVACGVTQALGDVPGIDLDLFWREARLTASAAQQLAVRSASVPGAEADPDQAYLCGLLHTSGHLILCRSYPEMARAMFSGFAPVRGAERAAIEREAFGIDYPEVGALWVEAIHFPPAVAHTIGSSLEPAEHQVTGLQKVLQGAVVLATAVAQQAGAAPALAAMHPALRTAFTQPSGEPDRAFTKIYDSLCEAEQAA
jgi:HD-like signal output (HDOD) protein